MRNTLICTVGTSLFESNLTRLSANTPDLPENWQAIKQAYATQDWTTLAREMLAISPSARMCGAEINTIEETKKNRAFSLENLVFLVSDTPHGKNTGVVLKKYFEQRQDLKLRTVDYQVIDDLQDERPRDFKTHGLRNLVRAIGDCVQKFGGSDYISIDATGGYKAQIAIAVIVGLALNIPVFYKHERFSEMIDFPPLPISFDYDVFGKNASLLIDFEKNNVFTSDEINLLDEKVRVLLTEVNEGDKTLYELSPIGQIYLTGFRVQNPKPLKLIPATNKKPPTFGNDHHYPIGFKAFVTKICDENAWIITGNSLSYAGQQAIKGIGFSVEAEGENKILVGTFKDNANFGAKFQLRLTDESPLALIWVADYLNRTYKEK